MKCTAIIGGTGAELFPSGPGAESLMTTTPYGDPSAPLLRFEQSAHTVLFLARHGREGVIPPHRVNYRANLHALREAGADRVIALNAVGGISADARPGAVVVPDQLVDYTWGRAHTYFDGPDDAKNFVEFTEPYDSDLRQSLIMAAQVAGVAVVERATYGVTQGPRLETAAEIDRLERDGCTVVGMTAMPEAALAAELGLAYGGLALVVNRAAGRSSGSIHAAIGAHLAQAMASAVAILGAFLRQT